MQIDSTRSPIVLCRFTLWMAMAASVAITACTSAAEKVPLRVMSFNIRYGTANDGDNHWQNRKEMVVQTVRQFDPDLIGTQETLAFQAKFLADSLEKYDRIGRSREATDGPDGEQCTVFFKRGRFERLDHGHIWLSETPEAPGSKSWDSSLPRMATWLKLRDKRQQNELYFVNTHFDHRGVRARLESAKLLRTFVTSRGQDARVILTGDFNCGEDSEPYKAMFPIESAHLLQDSYRVAHPQRADAEGTFNGFRGRRGGPRIDWVVVNGGLEVESASIVDWNKDGQYPSDHMPVTAVLK